ncbi:MAG: methyltransferase domain-containing protein, partial [Elusimicrobiota bacterium]
TLDEIREQQRASWNKFAPGWKKWDEFTMAFLRPVGEEMLREAALRPGAKVLDAACGTGEPGLSAARIVGEGGRVTGTDLSEEMIHVAREKARKLGLRNYEAATADAGALPFEDGSFDSVLCRMGIMFVPDPARTAREFFRVLKPGGRLALCVWAEPSKNPWATTIADIVNSTLGVPPPPPGSPGLFRQAQPGTLKALLGSAGFSRTREFEARGTRDYESPLQYWTLFTEVAAPIAGPLAKADEAQRKGIQEKVLQAAATFLKDGRPTFPWSAWVASGAK